MGTTGTTSARGNERTGKRDRNGIVDHDEQTPLLSNGERRSDVDGHDDTSKGKPFSGEDDGAGNNGEENEDKANQQVGKLRATLISISVFGLIFLQGIWFLLCPRYLILEMEGYTKSTHTDENKL